MQPGHRERADDPPDLRSSFRLRHGGVARAAAGHAAAATGHPLATASACSVLARGGSAVDAAIAAQAVICVVMPQAAGLGGDLLALVHDAGTVAAVNGTGCSPQAMSGVPPVTGGGSVTVPGLVDGWFTLHARWGRLPLRDVLADALALATDGIPVDRPLASAVAAQHDRLVAGGAGAWALLDVAESFGMWRQPELGGLLHRLGENGPREFYSGAAAAAMVRAVAAHGGTLSAGDLSDHRTQCPAPVEVRWSDGRVFVQPPASQGVLLGMALARVHELLAAGVEVNEHVLVEVTEATFEHRSRCGRGGDLLDVDLDVDLEHSSGRGGPRSYLHTAGVATVDDTGQVVSSLASVFDDFGSGVFTPELGFVLNNRAAGFTDGDNAPGPAKRPVHTLAPAMMVTPRGVLGVATPGADGQVQTLLQVLVRMRVHHASLVDAVSAPRWRSQDGNLLLERGHAAIADLGRRGHRTVVRQPGDDVFGAVVAAGTKPDGQPYAVADWRRQTTSEAVQ